MSCTGDLQLVERANGWSATLGVTSSVHFRVCNATVNFERILEVPSSKFLWPLPLLLIAIETSYETSSTYTPPFRYCRQTHRDCFQSCVM